MARHHVISTTGCDVFFKLVTHYKEKFGARFDDMTVTFGANGNPVLGATQRDAKSGCEMHRRAGQADECWCCGYDEQLEFVSQHDVPLAHADYRLTLSNGEMWTGTTNAKGRTERIGSKQEEQITTVEFFPPEDSFPCCSTAHRPAAPTAVIVELQDVTTRDTEVGTSVKRIKVDSNARQLTQGEIDMAWMIFEDAIDYSKVKIHKRPYLWLFQPENTAMTPNGEMYFHESRFVDDFSKEDPRLKHWFMHEMVHVWQFQLNYPVRVRGAIRLGLSYDYVLSKEQRLADYNMEAQGDLLADYFVLMYLNYPRAMLQEKYANSLPLYKEVLCDFIKNKKNKKIYLATILSVMIWSIYPETLARSRMANAEVTSINGLPCFSISAKEEARNGQVFLGALSVSDITEKPTTEVWGFLMTGGRKVPISSEDCIPYGHIPPYAQATPAPALRTGRMYEVFLNGRPKDPYDSTYGYVGKFCLAPDASGNSLIIAIKIDTQAWRDDACPVNPASQ